METKARADLVRALREEKQTRERDARGFGVLDAAGRAQGRVDRVVKRVRRAADRAGERAGREFDDFRVRSRAAAVRHDRALNQRHAARIARDGYDISPDFQRRSQAIANRAQSTELRQRAGTGIDRHRGALRDIANNPGRVTEAERTAAILRDRAERANRPRSRTIRGTVTYHDRRGPVTRTTRTDRAPPRERS